jgi:hypothetical protein
VLSPCTGPATPEELRDELRKHPMVLAPVLDLEALMASADGIANRDVPQGGAGNDARAPHHMSKRAARHGDQCLAGGSTGS